MSPLRLRYLLLLLRRVFPLRLRYLLLPLSKKSVATPLEVLVIAIPLEVLLVLSKKSVATPLSLQYDALVRTDVSLRFSETFVLTRAARGNIPEDDILKEFRCSYTAHFIVKIVEESAMG
jgi:hypothetical protein